MFYHRNHQINFKQGFERHLKIARVKCIIRSNTAWKENYTSFLYICYHSVLLVRITTI